MFHLATIDGLNYRRLDPSQEAQISRVAALIDIHLSEPYSIFVYWFFINNWPHYCYVVEHPSDPDAIVGVIISKVEPHRDVRLRGYIGMLVIDPKFRGKRIALNLVDLTIKHMIDDDHVDEVMLETETNNAAALRLYELFGFIRLKRMHRYYVNTQDAYRLILPVTEKSGVRVAFLDSIVE